MISLKKLNFLVTTVVLINTVTVASLPANSQSTRRTLQALPDGIYFYSKVRLPKQSGAEYILLRKRGRSFIAAGYIYESDGGCFSGTIRGNTPNYTRSYTPLESEEVVEDNSSLNLNQYNQLASRHISAGDREGLRGCINTMTR